MNFSCTERPQIISALTQERYDMVVIGGGITGAGIALDAAARGLKVALVERDDFASGTSSRSTKLIHGGLRYLKQLEFALVREVGSERAVVHNLAPHLVVPEKMLLPLTDKSMSALMTSIGLKVYDWLAGVQRDDRRKMLSRMQILEREPVLNPDTILGGAIYAEYRTDDARLTIEIAKTAALHGAHLINYCKAETFLYAHDRVSGIRVTDVLTGEIFNISSKVVINATGPWVDEIRKLNTSLSGKRLRLTKGIHLVFPHAKLPVQQAIYFEVGDGRMIFAIPRGRCTYVGTTDTEFDGDPDDVRITRADAEYLIRAVWRTFPGCRILLRDVESGWAGLRPLIHEAGKSASELSRKDEIFVSESGLISIAGGKLTGYRRMAERVVDRVIREHFQDRSLAACQTKNILLSENALRNMHDVHVYQEHIHMELSRFDLPLHTAGYLVHNYGAQCDDILHHFKSQEINNKMLALLIAELTFCIQHEMVCSITDFMIRRTGRLYFDISSVIRYGGMVVDEMGRQLGWDLEHRQIELTKLEEAISKAREFN